VKSPDILNIPEIFWSKKGQIFRHAGDFDGVKRSDIQNMQKNFMS